MPDLIITDEMVETAAYFYRNSARAALEAVAPLIAAAAWEEGYTEGSRGRMWDSINPYQTRAHVDRIERGSAIGYATEHAATHACPSARASGEPCSPYCADCGGRGWVA